MRRLLNNPVDLSRVIELDNAVRNREIPDRADHRDLVTILTMKAVDAGEIGIDDRVAVAENEVVGNSIEWNLADAAAGSKEAPLIDKIDVVRRLDVLEI